MTGDGRCLHLDGIGAKTKVRSERAASVYFDFSSGSESLRQGDSDGGVDSHGQRWPTEPGTVLRVCAWLVQSDHRRTAESYMLDSAWHVLNRDGPFRFLFFVFLSYSPL